MISNEKNLNSGNPLNEYINQSFEAYLFSLPAEECEATFNRMRSKGYSDETINKFRKKIINKGL